MGQSIFFPLFHSTSSLSLLNSLLYNVQEVVEKYFDFYTVLYLALFIVIYSLYFYKYKNYIYIQPNRFKKGKRILGKTLPSCVNGWFWVCNSSDLPKKKAMYFYGNGSNLVVFRGEDNIVYALDAYCSHMGANLADGTVTMNNCISCPFHNWTFDGKTGDCLSGKNLKKATKFKYSLTTNNDGNSLYDFVEATENDLKCNNKSKIKEKIKINEEKKDIIFNNTDKNANDHCEDNTNNPGIKNYIIFENAGIIYVYLHAIREKELNPDYYPLDLTEEKKKFVYRGRATNITTNQFQDMPENGADIAHFLYIHPQIIPNVIYGYWNAKWVAGDNPNLYNEIKSECQWITKFRTDLVNKYVNKNNASKIGIVLLENQISLFNCNKKILFFGLIGFQVGPSLVYLFLKSPFFETLFFQYSELKAKHEVEVHHEIWTQNWIPYFISAIKLRLEALQVTNDCKIWDNKKFGSNPWYNLSAEADQFLVLWRKFFCQYYEGCKEKEEKLRLNNSDW